MADLAMVFLLGPVFFLQQLLSIVLGSPVDISVFIVSGLGTAFWTAVASVIGGLA